MRTVLSRRSQTEDNFMLDGTWQDAPRTTSNLFYDWLQLMVSVAAELRDMIVYHLHESCTD